MRIIFNRFQPNVNSPNNVCYSTAILNLNEISSVDAEIRYMESMYINTISPGISFYVALMRYKDVTIVAKSKGSTLTNQLTYTVYRINSSSDVHHTPILSSVL